MSVKFLDEYKKIPEKQENYCFGLRLYRSSNVLFYTKCVIYTRCVILHSVCKHSVKYLIPYVCGGDLRCFVAGQICRKFTHFPSVKFPGLKMCACKKNDKYQVCLGPWPIPWVENQLLIFHPQASLFSDLWSVNVNTK